MEHFLGGSLEGGAAVAALSLKGAAVADPRGICLPLANDRTAIVA